jgi:site-specific recombinase XerD
MSETLTGEITTAGPRRTTDMVPAGTTGHGDGGRLDELLVGWLNKQKSAATARAYGGDARAWLDWCAASGLDPLHVDDAHLNAWRHVLELAGSAASTRARKLSAVTSFYTWLRRRGVVTVDLADTDLIPRPTAGVSRTVGLTDVQAAALLAAADADSHHAAALIGVLLYLGPRVGELCRADTVDLYTDQSHRVLHLYGKGGKERRVPVPPPALARLDTHLQQRGDVTAAALPVLTGQAGARPRVPLLVTSTGRRLYQSYVWHNIRRLATAAGGDLADLAPKLSPHSLRHTTITSALGHGVPLHRVQDLAGHASADTTRHYDRRRHELHGHAAYKLDFEAP